MANVLQNKSSISCAERLFLTTKLFVLYAVLSLVMRKYKMNEVINTFLLLK